MSVSLATDKDGPSCIYCGWDPAFISELDPCEAQGPRGFYCTRERGHGGEHVACGALCMTEVWPCAATQEV